VFQVELSEADVLSIVMSLVYDSRVDEVDGEDGDDHYRPALLPPPDESPFTNVPCAVCPVFSQCRPGGVISPETCVYFDQWLGQP
jgi:DNA-directed RNA polymerase III subunit RPC6